MVKRLSQSDQSSTKIVNITDPTSAQDAATKNYVDTATTNMVTTSGTQTLTNKTISGSSNTLSNIGIAALSATGTANSTTYLRGDGTWATPAGGSSSPLTTKGDVYTYDTANQRLGVGSNGTVLTADSTQATGLKWGTAGAGDMVLASAQTVTGAKLFNPGILRVNGATSGTVTMNAPAVAGSTTLTMPGATSTVLASVTAPSANPVTGTPSSTNFLSGSGTWATPPAPGIMSAHLGSLNADASADQITYLAAVIPTATQTVSSMKCIVTTNNYSTGASTTELGIYNSSRTLLSSGTVSIPATTTGIFTVTLGAAVSLTAGSVFYAALLDRTNTGDQVRYGYISNISNVLLSSQNSTGGNTSLPSTISGVTATGRNYWMIAY